MEPPARFSNTFFSTYRPRHPSQERALEQAQRLVERLRSSHSPGARLRRWLGIQRNSGPNGLYLVGPAGTGKTHLLAAAYHALHPTVPCAFVHNSQLLRMRERPHDLARRVADRYEVFCLDEMEIDDPASEARLVRLLRALEARDVTLVATSNVRPDRFLSAELGNQRFRRFLEEEFQKRYKIVYVGGEDHRRQEDTATGRGWIGSPEPARQLMRDTFRQDDREKTQWWSFKDLMTAATNIEHGKLIDRLSDFDSLYVADVTVSHTDDALRLLRIIDDLYLHPDPPAVYFTSPVPPEQWLGQLRSRGPVSGGIAEKFRRTTSRLRALCVMQQVDALPAEEETET